MKIKHKKIAHRLLNQFVIFSLIFQNFYPILYFTPVFAQTSNTILELSGDQEFTPPEQLEAITGSDCIEQAKEFNSSINIDGIILSKADVDEKGGTAISIGHVTNKPILFLGTGQTYNDLQKFDPKEVIVNLGLD